MSAPIKSLLGIFLAMVLVILIACFLHGNADFGSWPKHDRALCIFAALAVWFFAED